MTQNADPSELAKFSALADTWWNPFGPCQPLHEINPLRFEFISRYVSLQNKRVVDVGCGGGILTESIGKAGAATVGLDLSASAIDVARDHAASQNLPITYHVSSVEEFSAEHSHQFDVVTCMELLEHVPDPQSIIAGCASLLKEGGHAFFSTLNRNIKSFFQAILGAEYILRILPRGTHTYEKFIRPAELNQMLRQNHLDLRHMAGMQYQPITKQYRLTQNVSVNYLVHCISTKLG